MFYKSWTGKKPQYYSVIEFFSCLYLKISVVVDLIIDFEWLVIREHTLLHIFVYDIRDSLGLEWYVQPKVPNKIRSFGIHRIHNMVFAYVLFRYCCLPRRAATVIAINGTIAMERFYTVHSAVEYFVKSMYFRCFDQRQNCNKHLNVLDSFVRLIGT